MQRAASVSSFLLALFFVSASTTALSPMAKSARAANAAASGSERSTVELERARRELRRVREPARVALSVSTELLERCAGSDCRSAERLRSLANEFRSLRRELRRLEKRRRDGDWQRRDFAKTRLLRSHAETLGSKLSSRLAQVGPDTGIVQGSCSEALEGTGSISGTITADVGGTALEAVRVDVYTICGFWAGNGFTDGTGAYMVAGLGSGNYFARTSVGGITAGYIDELYDDIACPGWCDPTDGTPIAVTDGFDTPGIDFALTLGGSISGDVTEEAGGTGLPFVEIDIYDSGGSWVGYAYSDGSGAYSVGGLATGTYFANTSVWGPTAGYLDELYDDLPCTGWGCDPTTGTPIGVTQGIDTPNIDFALALGGSISGTVTTDPGGTPLLNVTIDIYDGSGSWISYGYVDGAGAYSAGGLPTGNFYARTQVFGADSLYVDELYDNHPCPGFCDPTTGTPIAVSKGADTPGIDFALSLGGSISGTITTDPGGTPLVDVDVDIYDSGGSWVAYGYTDGAGAYTVGGLATGNHFARTSVWGVNEDYVDELYDDIVCVGWWCDPTTGTAIAVTQGIDTPGIDFALALGGSISGTITAESGGTPLIDVGVDIFNSSGFYIGYGYTDGTGAYHAGGLPTGNYFARTYVWGANENYINELYDDIQCLFWCDPTSGTSIAVTKGSETSGIDFALTLGGSISGMVTSEASGDPLCNVEVDIYDSGGAWVGYGYSDGTGAYSVGGLPSADYFAATWVGWSNPQYIDELYDNISCPQGNCDVTTGTPIGVTGGANTPNIDFALTLGGSITGIVTAEVGGTPLVYVDIDIYDSGGDWFGYGYTDGTGTYNVPGLPTGNYFARTWVSWSNPEYIDELYDNISCPQGNCDVTTGTQIAVTGGAETGGIDFALTLGGSISGTVTAEMGGTPLVYVEVDIYDSGGGWVGYGYTDGSGAFSFGGLVTGSYFARTYVWGDNAGYIPELYDDIPCVGGCNVTAGTPIPVTVGNETTGIDFALVLGGTISGTVTDMWTGEPLLYVDVDIYDSGGGWIGYGYTDGTGAYSSSGLPTGDYFARTSTWGPNSGFIDELFDDIPCPDLICDVTTGTPVPVTLGVDTPNIDFELGDDRIFVDGFESGDTSAWSRDFP